MSPPPDYVADALERARREGKFNFGPKPAPTMKPSTRQEPKRQENGSAPANGRTQQFDERNPPPHGTTQTAEPIDLAAVFTFLGDAPTAPARALIKKLLPAEGVAVTGGQSSAGKTFNEIYKAICLATALPYFGHKIVERVGTAYVAAEGRAMMPNRFAAALAKYSITGRLPIVWPKRMPDFSTADGIWQFIRELKAVDERFHGDFGVRLGNVVIDTVAASFGMKDEDDNAEATRVCNTLRSIGDETGTLMCPVHHYGKNPESGLRGASAWKASADVVLGVLADIDPLSGKADNRELACAKARDGEQGPVSPFDLEFVELGRDADGDIYGSLVVVPNDGNSRFDKTKLTKSQRTIQEAIFEAIDSRGEFITPRAGMPPVKAAKVTDIREEFDRRYVVDKADPEKAKDAKRMAFKRAIDLLPVSKFGAGSVKGADWIWKITWSVTARRISNTETNEPNTPLGCGVFVRSLFSVRDDVRAGGVKTDKRLILLTNIANIGARVRRVRCVR